MSLSTAVKKGKDDVAAVQRRDNRMCLIDEANWPVARTGHEMNMAFASSDFGVKESITSTAF